MEENIAEKFPRKTHPQEKSNFFSHYFFCWELPIFFKSKEFTEDDVYEILSEYRAEALGDTIEKLWNEEEHSKKTPSLMRVLSRMFIQEMLQLSLVILVIDTLIAILQPICLRKVLDYFSNDNLVTKEVAYFCTGGTVMLSLLQTLTFHFLSLKLAGLGLKVRISCCSLIYRRYLKMKSSATTGQLINLISNDAGRLVDVVFYLTGCGSAILKFVMVVCFMDVTLGHSSIVGVSLLIICLFIQLFLSKQLTITRTQVASKTDHRIRLVNDIIYGIQVIKMYAWEKSFAKLVKKARKSENEKIFKANMIRIMLDTFRQYFPRISIFLCVLTTIATNSTLSPQYFFVLNSIYNNLNITVLLCIYLVVIHYSDGRASIQRIQKFLLSGNILKREEPSLENFVGVRIQNVNIKVESQVLLENVGFCATLGEVVGVVGATGSGKSILLKTILKETEWNGSIDIGGKLSYCSQEAWIFPGSVRQNILFGEKMDAKKFSEVVRVCALEHDLTILPNGDLTMVGERGVMLSGGQKARINLARAIYRDADIYLLDDPLSAVDANVARQIFSGCIQNYLKDKCVVLVTHQVRFLANVSKVYYIKNGNIRYASVKELNKLEDVAKTFQLMKSDAPLEIKELRTYGVANRHIYKKYLTAGIHWGVSLMIFILFIFSQVINTSTTCFVTFWINFQEVLSPEMFLYIYGTFAVFLTLSCHVQVGLFVKFCGRISKKLHSAMFDGVISTNMKFFNDHASGRILNRFTQDLGNIDERIPLLFEQVLVTFLAVLGCVIVISVLNYWLIIPAIILFLLFYLFSCISERINVNIRRSEGIAQSPIFTHLVATIQGITTIRASQNENILQKEFDKKQDTHSSAFYLFKAMFFTFSFWVDLTCVCYIATVNFSFFFFEKNLPANVGLALSESGVLIGLVQFGMKMWTELDAQMTSVERVVEFGKLVPEAKNSGYIVPKFWPQSGNIIFKSVSMRYSQEKPQVLKNIDLWVQPGEKIGIVGRTGAGKSSLITVLFRLFDFEGTIFIDGIDTKTVPLNLLRSSISIIPQDPVLFLGTLRKNLDPFEEFSDFQIWSALESIQLDKFVGGLPSGLESIVAESGSNFSVGQKQLFCMVRAMLRNNKIVVFDEATASIDLETDELIQFMVRKKFKQCTVLTIAHRLSTVMDSDKIVVMDSGEVAEFGEPKKLLQDVDGVFYTLVH